ncbi:predicted protein [Naegleria gruberi]|uniref:Predicted protein n=1 Tax=Naegleria gruberi TaxID=5762 RepID=D2VIA7_NAEGR|nr:uncharacterized protein NAEGRDRAFT_68620 [Naegleria gruberi]EFC43562.1 predicted protein [Naegleria gruberi]|eukprot:XP_002676306.1 predicted protein [Naegleria gruberi strain NEG-M]
MSTFRRRVKPCTDETPIIPAETTPIISTNINSNSTFSIPEYNSSNLITTPSIITSDDLSDDEYDEFDEDDYEEEEEEQDTHHSDSEILDSPSTLFHTPGTVTKSSSFISPSPSKQNSTNVTTPSLNLSPIKPLKNSRRNSPKTPEDQLVIPSPLTLDVSTRRRKASAVTPNKSVRAQTSSAVGEQVTTPLPHQYSFMYKHVDHIKRFRHTRYQTNQAVDPIAQFKLDRFEDSRELRNKLSLTNTSDIQSVGQYEFNAVRLTTCDWFIKGWQKTLTHTIRVLIDIYKKRIIFSYDSIIESKSEQRLTIPFDEITGIEFQHSPLSDDIIVIETKRVPEQAPSTMQSNFFFLYLSREDSAKYMDGALLSSDKRLLKLAIVGLPTWATIVNRYGIPVYYNHRVREVITTLVNIYIVISLIWGFYDLYKNLPIVGGALRALFGPVASYFEPLIKNKVMLLIPLVFSKVWEASLIFFSLFAPIVALFTPLWKLIVNLSHFITQIFKPLADFLVLLGNGIVYPFIQLYNHLLLPLFNFLSVSCSAIAKFIALFGTGLYAAIQVPVQLISFVCTELIDFVVELFTAISAIISYPVTLFKVLFNVIVGFFQMVAYPFTKIGSLFKYKKELEKATEVVTNVAMASGQAVSTTSTFKDYLMSLKENFQPLSSLWTGIRRIIDSIIHTYHTKIKHRSVWKRRILITIISLIVLAGFIIVFALVF